MDAKYESGKTGLEAFLEPWQIIALNIVWKSDKPIKSKDVWIQANQRYPLTISRASIINFLQYMMNQGVLEGIDATGKGGHYNLYRPQMNETEYKTAMVKTILSKIRELSPSLF